MSSTSILAHFGCGGYRPPGKERRAAEHQDDRDRKISETAHTGWLGCWRAGADAQGAAGGGDFGGDRLRRMGRGQAEEEGGIALARSAAGADAGIEGEGDRSSRLHGGDGSDRAETALRGHEHLLRVRAAAVVEGA